MLKDLYSFRKLQSLAWLIAVVCLISSCSSAFDFQKRRYSRGFYFSSTHNCFRVEPRTVEKKIYNPTDKKAHNGTTQKYGNAQEADTLSLLTSEEGVRTQKTRERTKISDTRGAGWLPSGVQPLKSNYSAVAKQKKHSDAKKGARGEHSSGRKLVLIIIFVILISLFVANLDNIFG